jgi:hypothetical protein
VDSLLGYRSPTRGQRPQLTVAAALAAEFAACTRARDHLLVSATGTPSTFLPGFRATSAAAAAVSGRAG